MEASQVYQILTGILMQLPSLLTMLGGVIVAVIRWKRHPKISLMVVISLALMILHLILFTVVLAILSAMMSYENFRMMQPYQALYYIAYNIILAILTAILLAAIFIQRKELPEGLAPGPLARAA